MALVIIVIVPNEDLSTKIKLTKVLCEIADAKRKVIGIILKKGGVYRTYHWPSCHLTEVHDVRASCSFRPYEC
jgi:hypothetical protein